MCSNPTAWLWHCPHQRKPDKEKIKSLMEGDNLYIGKETNVLDVIIVFSILAMYNLIQTAI